MVKPVRRVTDPNVIAVGHLVALLERGVLTLAELARETGLNVCTVERYCASIYNAGGAHIGGWKQDARGAYSIRIYKLGSGVDAIAPVVSKSEKARRLRVARQKLRGQLQRGETLDPGTLRAATLLRRS